MLATRSSFDRFYARDIGNALRSLGLYDNAGRGHVLRKATESEYTHVFLSRRYRGSCERIG